MKAVPYIIAALALLGAIAYAGASMIAEEPVMEPTGQATAQTWKTTTSGATGMGDVQVDLTPQSFADGRLVVDVRANTHSVDLSQFDLEAITTLDINAEKLRPISAPALGGHHAGGELVFKTEPSDAFSIVIQGIPAVQERVHSWQ